MSGARHLGPRLAALRGVLPPDAALFVDIGCDHADLVATLRAEGHLVLGVDRSAAALRAAARRHDWPNHPPLWRGDGITALTADAACCIAAGIGSQSLVALLDAAADAPRMLAACVHDHGVVLRDWLRRHDWQIVAEDLLRERGRWYRPIFARSGRAAAVDEADWLVGPRLIAQRHPLLPAFLADVRRRRAGAWRRRQRGADAEARFLRAVAAVEARLAVGEGLAADAGVPRIEGFAAR